MPWRPGRNGGFCRICGRPTSECGPVSARGKCERCRTERLVAGITQMQAHAGPFFEHWRRQTAASVGATLTEDL